MHEYPLNAKISAHSWTVSTSIYPKQYSTKSWNFLSAKSWNWVQKVEIDCQAQVSSVKAVCQYNNRQLLYVIFLVRIKNMQKDVRLNHKSCKHKAVNYSDFSFIHVAYPQSKKPQERKAKMQNYWLTTKTWEMFWNKCTFLISLSLIIIGGVVSVKCCRKSFLKPCLLFVC